MKEHLKKEHLDLMDKIAFGATIWEDREAKLIREIQSQDPGLVEIIPVKELGYDGAQQIPYFGAILTDKGFNILKSILKSNKMR